MVIDIALGIVLAIVILGVGIPLVFYGGAWLIMGIVRLGKGVFAFIEEIVGLLYDYFLAVLLIVGGILLVFYLGAQAEPEPMVSVDEVDTKPKSQFNRSGSEARRARARSILNHQQ